MKRVFLASPTYGPVQPEVYTAIINAVMFASKPGIGIEWKGTANADRESWESARNSPVAGLRDRKDLDGIIWQDSDMLIPVFAYARLLDHNVDLVSAMYFQRKPPYWPNAYGWNPKDRKFHRMRDYPADAFIPTGGFGFGCCYTSMRLLWDLPEDPFQFEEFSEDLGFCYQASQAGYQPYLDTGIQCDHYIGPRWSNEKLFKRWKSAVLTNKAALVGGSKGEVGGDIVEVPANA